MVEDVCLPSVHQVACVSYVHVCVAVRHGRLVLKSSHTVFACVSVSVLVHCFTHPALILCLPLPRLNFPRGFPDEYSFMVTFRMIKNTVNKVWNVWQIVDEEGNKQAGLRLNGDQQALEYFLIDADGNLQTVTFPGLSVLFNTRWHKVMIGVERNQVTLYVDCQPVDMKPIKGKGPINTEGDTLIGRLDADPDASVVVREAGRAFIMSSDDSPCMLHQRSCAFSHV